MKMYRTGYIAATIEKNNGFSYFAWPLLQIENDIIAESLTDEADDKWFTKYDMPEIAPDLEYVKRYVSYCHSINIDAVILQIEIPFKGFETTDEITNIITYGYDCIGAVGYSFLENEFSLWKDKLKQNNINLNEYGLFKSIEDVNKFISLRQLYISQGLDLENYWNELPIRISEII